jgi:hypothetical protein
MGQNPPAGAIIDYTLAAPAKSPVRLEILEDSGQTVRAYASDDPPEELNANRYFPESWVRHPPPPPASAGHHRFVWDLRYPRPRADRYEYSIAGVRGEDTPIEPRGPLAQPGRYTVRLTVDGKRLEQPLVLGMDPRVRVAPEVLAGQAALEREVVQAMDASFGALARVRAFRAQLAKRSERAESKGTAAEAIAEADSEAHRLEGGEGHSGRRGGGGLAGVNATLGAILTAVDAADAAPTAIQREGYAAARASLEDLMAGWRKLSGDGMSKLNEALRGAGLPEVTTEELEQTPAPAGGNSGVEIE